MHTFKQNIHQFYNYSKLRFFSVTTITRITPPQKKKKPLVIRLLPSVQCTYLYITYDRAGLTPHPCRLQTTGRDSSPPTPNFANFVRTHFIANALYIFYGSELLDLQNQQPPGDKDKPEVKEHFIKQWRTFVQYLFWRVCTFPILKVKSFVIHVYTYN